MNATQANKRIDELAAAWNGINRAVNILDACGDSSELTDALRDVRSKLDDRIERFCQQSAATVGSD